MPTALNPYIGFRDEARQAMEFYRDVFGGDLTLSTFGEMHASEDPTEQDKVMHSVLVTPHGLLLMASDTPNGMEAPTGSRISISLSGDDGQELHGYWDGLADGATIIAPLTAAPWGDEFGMLSDRFGVTWLVNGTGPRS
ncbi:VOC family protein [Curtobacterium sp. MCBD17_034]|uniref:VOC family protein n=1 Tax=unclassified Curtobacterium TaxID=257496 RepID=UPI000DA898CB|nr:MULTISPECIES: VOC family protein [unclassified Curtobacterium]PZF60389.1 VOC family protein [Curtobacterium sp. MCBD17_034]PZM35075.1 VOC family protein [Curtobacterium sp. MCBD17_031]